MTPSSMSRIAEYRGRFFHRPQNLPTDTILPVVPAAPIREAVTAGKVCPVYRVTA
jgi:hypothetical protein